MAISSPAILCKVSPFSWGKKFLETNFSMQKVKVPAEGQDKDNLLSSKNKVLRSKNKVSRKGLKAEK